MQSFGFAFSSAESTPETLNFILVSAPPFCMSIPLVSQHDSARLFCKLKLWVPLTFQLSWIQRFFFGFQRTWILLRNLENQLGFHAQLLLTQHFEFRFAARAARNFVIASVTIKVACYIQVRREQGYGPVASGYSGARPRTSGRGPKTPVFQSGRETTGVTQRHSTEDECTTRATRGTREHKGSTPVFGDRREPRGNYKAQKQLNN